MSDKAAMSLEIEVTASELENLIIGSARAGRALMIHGSPGIGKSCAIQNAAAHIAKGNPVVQLGDPVADPKASFGLFDVRLSQCDPVDVGGLPYADRERGIQRRLVADWFPSTDRDDLPEHGILLLEEIVSAKPAVQAAAYQLTLDRRIGDKVMKKGWAVVLTGNKMTDGGVVHKMPTPLANRLTHVYVRSDNDSWISWARGNGIDLSVVAFLRFRPSLLNTFEQHVSTKSKDHAFATERSWHAVSDLIKTTPGGEPPLALVSGTVGTAPASEFTAFRKVWQTMPDIDGILKDPDNAPVPDQANVRYAVCTALAGRLDNADMEDGTLGTMFSSILTYLDRLEGGKDFAIMTIKDAMRVNPMVTTLPAFAKAAQAYRDLLC